MNVLSPGRRLNPCLDRLTGFCAQFLLSSCDLRIGKTFDDGNTQGRKMGEASVRADN